MHMQMTVKVNKVELLEKIKIALEEHKTEYEKALRGWCAKMQIAAENVVTRVKTGELKAFPNEFRNLMAMPSLHVEDFEKAIKMLEMSVDDEIELEPDDFDQLVLGNWAWKEQWAHTNALYSRE